jgi:hypothetical protein
MIDRDCGKIYSIMLKVFEVQAVIVYPRAAGKKEQESN